MLHCMQLEITNMHVSCADVADTCKQARCSTNTMQKTQPITKRVHVRTIVLTITLLLLLLLC
jgi:hypothetical protein